MHESYRLITDEVLERKYSKHRKYIDLSFDPPANIDKSILSEVGIARSSVNILEMECLAF